MSRNWVVVAGALVASGALAEGNRITVDEAVQEALSKNDQTNAARARAQAAEASAKSVRGRLLPGVHLSEEAQHWNSAFALPFGATSFTVREQNTNTFSVAANQPLVGLLHLGNDYGAASASADAAQAGARTVEDAVRENVRVGFLRYFQARAAEGIARASEAQLNEQVQLVKNKLAAGVLTNADLLRTQVAAANARQQEIQAQVQGEVARASLLAAIGRAPDDPVEFVEPAELEQTNQPLPEPKNAQSEALQKRPEIARVESEASAAHKQANSRLFELLPEVNLEAAYLNLQGQPFQPENSSFIGIRAEWNVFDWGADWYAHRSADAQASAARLLADDERRQVEVDVTQKLAIARAAANAVDVANAAIQSAEEAYRVTDALVKAGSATTTDLLDAQSALTTARLNLARARYDLAIARVSLNRSIGTER
jgi:outer membrane protein